MTDHTLRDSIIVAFLWEMLTETDWEAPVLVELAQVVGDDPRFDHNQWLTTLKAADVDDPERALFEARLQARMDFYDQLEGSDGLDVSKDADVIPIDCSVCGSTFTPDEWVSQYVCQECESLLPCAGCDKTMVMRLRCDEYIQYYWLIECEHCGYQVEGERFDTVHVMDEMAEKMHEEYAEK